mmetsp:Transcript_59717/g.177674  ORF Transcript_59717/g.177674 Transcript_59717/m.177674 type:complete len:553 (-) Transcript_59717:20-1678(-)
MDFRINVCHLYRVLIVVVLAEACSKFVRHLEPAVYRSWVRCSTSDASARGPRRHAGHPSGHGHAKTGSHGHPGRPSDHSHPQAGFHGHPGHPGGQGQTQTGCFKRAARLHRWSGSEHCGLRGIVVGREVRMKGRVTVAGRIGYLAVPLFAGPMMDLRGRKPVIVSALLCSLAQVGLFLAADVADQDADLVQRVGWLVPSGAFAGVSSAFEPAVAAMVADLSEATVDSRGVAFSLLIVVKHLSHVAGIAVCFAVIRQRLGEYSAVLGGCLTSVACVAASAALLLRESLPPRCGAEGGSFDGGRTSGSDLAEEVSSESDSTEAVASGGDPRGPRRVRCCAGGARALLEICRDRFLLHFLLVHFLQVLGGTVAHAILEPYFVSHMGYSMQGASVCAIILILAMALGSALSRLLLPAVGPLALYGGGMLAVALGFGACGLSGPCIPGANAILWVGLLLACLGLGLSQPASCVIASSRASPGALGLFFTILHCTASCGGLCGELLSTQLFFDARATGWEAGLSFFASSVAVLASLAWFVGACLCSVACTSTGVVLTS